MDSPHRASPRILIAEDEVAIALDLEVQLHDAGFETIGPAFNADQARELAASERIDAAVLDIDLIKQAFHDVLWPLLASATPMIFITGHDLSALPDWVPPARVFLKPFFLTDLIKAVERALGTTWPVACGANTHMALSRP
jgi:DNA-binding NtrC family response regulator